jgi:hypothetical protein
VADSLQDLESKSTLYSLPEEKMSSSQAQRNLRERQRELKKVTQDKESIFSSLFGKGTVSRRQEVITTRRTNTANNHDDDQVGIMYDLSQEPPSANSAFTTPFDVTSQVEIDDVEDRLAAEARSNDADNLFQGNNGAEHERMHQLAPVEADSVDDLVVGEAANNAYNYDGVMMLGTGERRDDDSEFVDDADDGNDGDDDALLRELDALQIDEASRVEMASRRLQSVVAVDVSVVEPLASIGTDDLFGDELLGGATSISNNDDDLFSSDLTAARTADGGSDERFTNISDISAFIAAQK